MPETAPAQKLDDETTAALTLLNEYVNADREATRHKREIAKAEKAKDQAAAAVRKLEKDGGSTDGKAEAEKAYRESVAALKAIREGKKPEASVATTAEPEAEAEATTAEPEAADSGDDRPADAAADAEPSDAPANADSDDGSSQAAE